MMIQLYLLADEPSGIFSIGCFQLLHLLHEVGRHLSSESDLSMQTQHSLFTGQGASLLVPVTCCLWGACSKVSIVCISANMCRD